MLPEGNSPQHIDRLHEMDAINKTGTIKQKQKCLRNVIFDGRSAILPKFYRKGCAEDGVRDPGDEGPDPQVQTDHESDEEGEDPKFEQQEEEHTPMKKPNRPRDLVKRRVAARKWAQKDTRINPTRRITRKRAWGARMSEEERESQREMDRAGDRRRVANQTTEERAAHLVRRRETTAKRMATMNEEGLAIHRAKESAIRSKSKKHKWLGNSEL